MAASTRIPTPRSTRSSERCYQILRRMLTCAQVVPGTPLREVEWSEKLGVRRATLREAMVLLVHDGLLLRRASGGFFTPQLNEIDIDLPSSFSWRRRSPTPRGARPSSS